MVLALVGLFQVALIAGAPLGEYAFGGQNPGKLPTRFRVASVVTLAVYLGVAGHMLAQLGVLPKLLPTQFNAVANWVIFALNLMGLVMNSITRSRKERMVWAPVALVLAAASLLVALG